MRKYFWPMMLAVSWAFVVATVVLARSRGFDLRLLDGVWGNFIAIGALTSWLGITAVFVDPVREWLSRVFGSQLGCGMVVAVLLGVGATLLIWSRNRVHVVFDCEPCDLELRVDNERVDSRGCQRDLWTSMAASVSARAPKHQQKDWNLKDLLKADPATASLKLETVDRWTCSLHEGQLDDSEPFLGCGKGIAPWTRSRTWRVEISPGTRSSSDIETAKAPRVFATFPLAPGQTQHGIALHGLGEGCYAEGDDRKDPAEDAIGLFGCGVFKKSGELERYQVRLSMCVSEGTIAKDSAELVNFQIGEKAGKSVLDCKTPRTH